MTTMLALIVALLPSPAPGGSPDPNFARFLGTWSCMTAAGSSVVMTFTQATDDVLHLSAPWKNGGAEGTFEHVFTHAAAGGWTTSNRSPDNSLRFTGTSAGFDGDAIAFTGIQTVQATSDSVRGERSYPERETFRFTPDGRMEHLWEISPNGSPPWKLASYSSCKKM